MFKSLAFPVTRKLHRVVERALGLPNVDEELAGHIRAEQIRSIARLTPVMMLATVVNASILIYAYWDIGPRWFLAAWGLVIPFGAFIGIRSWLNWSHFASKRTISERGIHKAVMNSLLFGILWGLLPAVLFDRSDGPNQLLLACLTAGMLSGGAFALSTIPLAAIVNILAITIGSAIALTATPLATFIVTGMLLVIYSGTIFMACCAHGRLFISRVLTQTEVEQQGQIIGLLLKDFEESASDWLWATDHEGRLGHVSKRFSTVFGRSPEELRGCRLLDVLSVERAPAELLDCAPVEALSQQMANRKPFRDIVVPMIIKGEVRWLSFSGKATERPNGSFNGYRGVGSDVTTEKRAKERLAYLARHDALTGLANRMQFREGLNLAISRVIETGEKFAILCIDLDRFKCVNDTRGHPFGDTLLTAVAERIRQCVDTHDIVARLGGDEFAIIQTSAKQPNNAIALAQQIIDAINQPFKVNGSIVSVAASVGLSVAPGDGLDADTLLKNADLALYRAKNEGRSAYRFFEQEMDARAQERNGLELDLRRVEFDQAFQLYFQPLHNVELGQISGFEALIRWHHPKRGIVTPAEFIPIAEEIGIIKPIGEWVLRNACAAATNWPNDISVAVNLSPLQFGGGEIVDIVRRALDVSGLAPNRLELEITEGLLIQHTEAVLVELEELKGLGVSIAMDDFGTGYSSLSYLWRFPFDKIKIDRSFVSALGKDKAVEDILRTILSLGLQSKMCVVAEGVETEHQAAFLSEISCHQLQGFYFGKPVPEEELPLLLLNQHRKKLSEHALLPAA